MNPMSTASIETPERRRREHYASGPFRLSRVGSAFVVLLALAWSTIAPLSVLGQSASPSASGPDPVAVATEFLTAISAGNSAAAEALETPEMVAAAPAAQLDQLWSQLVAQYGAFQSIGSTATATPAPPFTNVGLPVLFANATVELIVTISQTGQVGGLHLGSVTPNASGSPGEPAEPTALASPPEYVDQSSFTEREVTVGAAPWALPGTLSLPNGGGPFPAVVLVAGSGPEDRDETIGPNKPLRDLAWGFASAGIATLRYDKRTLAHGAQMAAEPNITVREETMDDAAEAVELLRSTPAIDPDRVFLIGHSLGGYLAPRIAATLPGQLRGIGMLEANSTPLPELIMKQLVYLASLPGASPATKQAVEQLRPELELAGSPELSPSTPPSELPFNTPASYWLDLQSYDPVSAASALPIPEFFSQGGRDYQVPPSELEPYRSALSNRSDVNFNEYPALSHILIAGTGEPSPSEYAVPGHVDRQLVADLIAWIRAN
jgi:fermentation-respiration switch protein FrsA (DUF1100 family)